jgi:hypothetical protein
LPHPTACAFRFSQPLDALIRPEPAGLVSCQIRSWGSPSRAFLLPRSRMPSPAPIPSWRWFHPRSPTSEVRRSRSYLGYAPASHTEHVVGPSRASPAFRVLLHARVRHLPKRFKPRQARSSPGPFLPSRVFPLAGTARLSPHLPSWSSSRRPQATATTPLQGLTSSEIGLPLSELPTLLGFARLVLSQSFEKAAIRESPPQVPGYVTAP